MSLIELHKISRFYRIGKNDEKYVLRDITLSFPSHGLISILGKSGCGKSTLLNIIGKIDKPSEGIVYFDKEDISKFNEKKTARFRNHAISYIFQHYHLFENQTAIYNVMLPALISGDSYKVAYSKAEKLLKSFSIKPSLYDKRCADLSGGEKERIAILRAFINKPRVILADEPTGALDKNNAHLAMNALKKISKTSLVIMVTHSESLANQYSDRIIKMSDGKIIKDQKINNLFDKSDYHLPKKIKLGNNWLNKIVASNFAKRFKRNIFSISALVVGLVATMLIIGFVNGKDASITKSMENQFDYGTASISKENRLISADSPITLIQTMRPNEEERQEIKEKCIDFNVCYSYDALVSSMPTIAINDEEIEGLSYLPIYSFVDNSTNHSLLIKGKIPTFDTLNQVVINQHAYQLLNKTLKFDSLNSYLRIKDQQKYSFQTDDPEKPYVDDYFVFDRLVQVVGVVKEINFLNTPKIYYSHLAMEKDINEMILNNLSLYKGDTSWKDVVIDSLDNSPLSSYSCRLFLKDFSHLSSLRSIDEKLGDSFSITCNGLTVEETLFSLVDAASIGMEVFLSIAIIGITMILGIISFASYNEDIKDSAILLCYGARRDDIASIYVSESLILGLISVVISFLLGILLTRPVNLLIEHFTSLIDCINIPLSRFLNRPFLFPFLIVGVTMIVCLLATYLPIGFSKKISLKEELKAND